MRFGVGFDRYFANWYAPSAKPSATAWLGGNVVATFLQRDTTRAAIAAARRRVSSLVVSPFPSPTSSRPESNSD